MNAVGIGSLGGPGDYCTVCHLPLRGHWRGRVCMQSPAWRRCTVNPQYVRRNDPSGERSCAGWATTGPTVVEPKTGVDLGEPRVHVIFDGPGEWSGWVPASEVRLDGAP